MNYTFSRGSGYVLSLLKDYKLRVVFTVQKRANSNSHSLGKYHRSNIHAFKNIVQPYKTIRISPLKYSITGEDLAEWLAEVSTPQEIEEVLFMIRCAQKRGSEIKSILQTLAAAVLK
ncbi:hypothetical protein ACTHO0_06655 [Cytobacillus praedii]|uniref:hypothetical protein n=1 Tax=Cytobacillus praedii TaxID=1742358 RepID=UPI003F818216